MHNGKSWVCSQSIVLQIFTKFHRLILSMPDIAALRTAKNGSAKKKVSLKKAGKMKRDNDLKWKMLCDLIEQLLSYLHRHDRISSHFVWTDIIRQRLLHCTTDRHRHTDAPRNAIILCRILLVLGHDLFRQIEDQSLLVQSRQFLVEFLRDFVPRDFKNVDDYNDLMTMQDMEDAFKLIARYNTEQQRTYGEDGKLSGCTVYSDSADSKLNKPTESADAAATNGAVHGDGDHDIVMEAVDGTKWKAKDSPNGGSNEQTLSAMSSSTMSMDRQDRLVDPEEALHRLIEDHYARTRVKGKERAQKDQFIAHIARCWKKVLFTSCPSLHSRVNRKKFDVRKCVGVFGSTACKLDSAGADIDIYVTTPPALSLSGRGEWDIFKLLSQELQSSGRRGSGYPNRLKVINIFHCTVPIIKMVDVQFRIDADLSFGKRWENSRIVQLINQFCDFRGDEVVRQFIVAVKHWASRRGLNDSQSNRLNSFGWVLMAIRYLQSERVLPLIRRTGPHREQIGFVDPAKKGSVSLGTLMRGFFAFWAEFDYDALSISLYKETVWKDKRRYYDLSGYELVGNKLVFVIEDPVQSNYNCSKNVRKFTANLMKIEFYRSMMMLKYGDGDLDSLCRSVQ